MSARSDIIRSFLLTNHHIESSNYPRRKKEKEQLHLAVALFLFPFDFWLYQCIDFTFSAVSKNIIQTLCGRSVVNFW